MGAILAGLEALFRAMPLSLLEVWGRFGYLIGCGLMLAAFGGFTFRPNGRWGLGRERQSWDARALLCVPLTMALVLGTGYLGSSVVLVPGAQTFESLKDLMVFLCIVLFGYPALLAVPPAYMLSDLIEGVPPAFLADWWVGYFINPSCFWVAYQLIGKAPDFRRARTWLWYVAFVVVFMAIEPQLWGYICANKFTPEISYRSIMPALFFTTAVTWMLAPVTMLAVFPFARRHRLYWAEIPGRVRERLLGKPGWVWESGREKASDGSIAAGVPIRIFLAAPFIGLVLVMVGAVAFLSLRWGEDGATELASRLHQQLARTIELEVDDALLKHAGLGPIERRAELDRLLRQATIMPRGRAFIADRSGHLIATDRPAANATDDAIIREAIRTLNNDPGGLAALAGPAPFRFAVVTAKPLGRAIWLARATPYDKAPDRAGWIIVTASSEADYLSGVRAGHSQSAMVIAVALMLSLLVIAALAGTLTAPIERVSHSAQAMARGDLTQRVPQSRIEELGAVASSFNTMASELERSRADLEADIRKREAAERALRQNEEHLEDLVTERTQALATANKELEAFSYSVSHDLRAPLRAVDGFARILAEDYAASLDDAGRDHIKRILDATRNMANLIDCLLDLARVTRRELNRQPVNLSQVAAEIVRDLRVADADRSVEVDIAPQVTADADPILIRQVLQNLLGNAWKFTARAANAKIQFASKIEDGAAAFEVSDNGAGFDMAYADKLFRAFQRLHNLRDFDGSGIGLAIVERIVVRHGGRVWARGQVGRGATIGFTLGTDGRKAPLS